MSNRTWTVLFPNGGPDVAERDLRESIDAASEGAIDFLSCDTFWQLAQHHVDGYEFWAKVNEDLGDHGDGRVHYGSPRPDVVPLIEEIIAAL